VGAEDFERFNPHLHRVFLVGGFAFFLNRSHINERLARNFLGWTRNGYSLDR